MTNEEIIGRGWFLMNVLMTDAKEHFRIFYTKEPAPEYTEFNGAIPYKDYFKSLIIMKVETGEFVELPVNTQLLLNIVKQLISIVGVNIERREENNKNFLRN